MRGNTVDRRISRHHAQRALYFDARHPRREEYIAQGALGDLHGAALESADRLALPGIMTKARDHLVRGRHVLALGPLHNGLRDARAQIRILAVSFLVSS